MNSEVRFRNWVAAQHGHIDAGILDDRVPWLCPDCHGLWSNDPNDGDHYCEHWNAPTVEQVLAAGERLIMARREGGGLFVKAPCDEDVDW